METNLINKYSRQLILAGWSLALQESLSTLNVSIPNNLFLYLYLKAVGINKFHFQENPQFNIIECEYLNNKEIIDYSFTLKTSGKIFEIEQAKIGNFTSYNIGSQCQINYQSTNIIDKKFQISLETPKYVNIEQLIGPYLANLLTLIHKETNNF